MSQSELVRPNILRIRPYSPGKPIHEVQRELGLTDVIKLASNENPLGPSPKAIKAIEDALEEVHLYPDAGCVDLRVRLADRYDLAASQVAVGNGSDELLTLLGMAVIEPGDEIVMGDPSFISYALVAHRLAATPKMIPLTKDERHDLPAMAAACTEKTKLVFVANPNNPTGTIVQEREVLEFLDALPLRVMAVFDEAYYEYVTHPAYPDSLSLLGEGRNIAVLRTFSKAYGLAGLRVGYMLGQPWMVDAVDRAREPFNVSSLAQVAAAAALDDATHVRRSQELAREGLATAGRRFDQLGFWYSESYSNFAWVDVEQPAQEVFDGLLRLGVIVRPGHIFGRPTHLRVTIGTESEMERFHSALVEVLGA